MQLQRALMLFDTSISIHSMLLSQNLLFRHLTWGAPDLRRRMGAIHDQMNVRQRNAKSCNARPRKAGDALGRH
jgi:hypothetical protein